MTYLGYFNTLNIQLFSCKDFGDTAPQHLKTDFVDSFCHAVENNRLTKNEINEILLKLPEKGFIAVGKNFRFTNIASVLISNPEFFSLDAEIAFPVLTKIDFNSRYIYKNQTARDTNTLGVALVSSGHYRENFNLSTEQLLHLFSQCDLQAVSDSGLTFAQMIATKNERDKPVFSLKEFQTLLQKYSLEQQELDAGFFYVYSPYTTPMSLIEVNQKLNLVKHKEKIVKALNYVPFISSEKIKEIEMLMNKVDILGEKQVLEEAQNSVLRPKIKLL